MERRENNLSVPRAGSSSVAEATVGDSNIKLTFTSNNVETNS